MQILTKSDVSSLQLRRRSETDFHRELKNKMLSLRVGEGVLTKGREWKSRATMQSWLCNAKNVSIWKQHGMKFGYRATEANEIVIIRKS